MNFHLSISSVESWGMFFLVTVLLVLLVSWTTSCWMICSTVSSISQHLHTKSWNSGNPFHTRLPWQIMSPGILFLYLSISGDVHDINSLFQIRRHPPLLLHLIRRCRGRCMSQFSGKGLKHFQSKWEASTKAEDEEEEDSYFCETCDAQTHFCNQQSAAPFVLIQAHSNRNASETHKTQSVMCHTHANFETGAFIFEDVTLR